MNLAPRSADRPQARPSLSRSQRSDPRRKRRGRRDISLEASPRALSAVREREMASSQMARPPAAARCLAKALDAAGSMPWTSLSAPPLCAGGSEQHGGWASPLTSPRLAPDRVFDIYVPLGIVSHHATRQLPAAAACRPAAH
ncbi:hypothetical protein Rsub_05043 [Raphidocelis subcapitata]|uniref:Uncharacterized protein n=1 Tax=Raphidocelis subcapitata TaxID=307507 RepID=A0A2V0NYG7_9CHLO|nr:hypothetical protein Rsub_05043 [Raphidocelis subcapitata]|eukprot:GBF92674.1 hypothetical protein Rsub_05043 [Raphidocelis subcapitata]